MHPLDHLIYRLAEAAGVGLVETSGLDPHLNAVYHSPTRTIIVRWGLDPVTRRCAIAHELGHAHYDDDCSTPGAETRADEYGAEELLSLQEVAAAADRCDGNPAATAADLGVTPEFLGTWMRLHDRGRFSTSKPSDSACLCPAT